MLVPSYPNDTPLPLEKVTADTLLLVVPADILMLLIVTALDNIAVVR